MSERESMELLPRVYKASTVMVLITRTVMVIENSTKLIHPINKDHTKPKPKKDSIISLMSLSHISTSLDYDS